MNSNAFGAVNWNKYRDLLPVLFPKARGFAVVRSDGETVWKSDEDFDVSDGGDSSWQATNSGLGRLPVSQRVFDTRQSIRVDLSPNDAWLIVRHDSTDGIAIESADTLLKRGFDAAIAVLEDELALQVECDQLAVELTERYEELNLVYSSDDHVEYFEESQKALANLVYNCVDYLNVGLAILVCRDKNLEVVTRDTNANPGECNNIQKLFKSKIYDWVEAHAEPLVLNDADDPQRHSLFSPHRHKVVVQPVVDDHNTVIGILGIAKPPSAPPFSNGDRNLLEVIARKASHIIHTHHDSLTGLMNRSGFESMLLKAIRETGTDCSESCLLHIDIDQLHVVNDTLGFEQGDAVLRKCAAILREILRDTDVLGRLDGDGFGVLLGRCGIPNARAISEKIASRIASMEIFAGGKQVAVTACIGIAPLDKDTDSVVSLLASAEVALAEAKDAGQNRIVAFEQDNTAVMRRSEEVGWNVRIRDAIRDSRFTLFAQPVVPLQSADGRTHYELLLRLFDDDGSIVPPGKFMPAAERYQLMPMVDRWVIRTALDTLENAAGAAEDAVYCINLSGQSLTNPGFERFLIDAVQKAGPLKKRLCFEVTETAAIANLDEAVQLIQSVKRLGCRFALDDFGAGLSSFGYLKVLPLDYLKIDGSFVKDVVTDRVSRSMVEAITGVGHAMGLSVIGEFVENDDVMQIIRDLGVDYGQGYGIGKPEPLADALRSLNDERSA